MSDAQTGLPALCAELKLHADGTVALVNSRDVAELFEKRHDHVLRDIDAISTSPNLGTLNWFRQISYLDAKGENRRSFDMTRQGFTVLVNRWTGEKATAFQIRYIEAFDAMEAALREPSTSLVTPELLLQAISISMKEIVAPLSVHFVEIDNRFDGIENRFDRVENRLSVFEKAILERRRNLTVETKRVHVEDSIALGGRCQCCSVGNVIENGQRSRFAEFDHFYQNSKADADHTWLICKPCHSDFTSGRVPRDRRLAEFKAYQEKRRRLPGRQGALLF